MKIYQLLNALSKEEGRLLKKAVQSPLYTTNPKIGQLLALLIKQAPDFDISPTLHRKHFKKLFPQEVYSKNKLQKLTSNLTKVIEQLLLFQAQEVDVFAKQKRLNKIFQERGLTQLFQYTNTDLLGQLDTWKVLDVHYHQAKFDVLSAKYFHPLHDKYDLKDNTLLAATNSLNTAFAIYQLRMALALKSRAQVINEAPDLYFLEVLKEAWTKGILKHTPLIELYLLALNLSEAETKVGFANFEEKLFQEMPQLSRKDQQFLFLAGLNYAVQQKNKNIACYKSIPFKWLKFGLANHLLITKQIMEEASFANIVVLGCQEGKFEWVLNFIDSYNKYLVKKDRTAAVLYYQSLVYYSQGDWKEALAVLTKNNYKSIYQPRMRMIIIRALFEKFIEDKEYCESLLSHLQAFEAYIRRNETIAKEKIIYYKNFILITRQLVNRIHRYDKPKRIKDWFDVYINKNPSVSAKTWLSEKVTQL